MGEGAGKGEAENEGGCFPGMSWGPKNGDSWKAMSSPCSLCLPWWTSLRRMIKCLTSMLRLMTMKRMSLMGPWWKILLTMMNRILLRLGIMKSSGVGRSSVRSKAASKASGVPGPLTPVSWTGMPCVTHGQPHGCFTGSHGALQVGDPLHYRTDRQCSLPLRE